jgi:transposase-like protein
MRFFRRLLRGQGMIPSKIVTVKLASYSAAKKELIPVYIIRLFSMKIIDVSYQTSRLGDKKGKCEGSNPKDKLNIF